MKMRILGEDLKVSAVGFGCMGLSHAYGRPVEEKEAVSLLEKQKRWDILFLILRRCTVLLMIPM